MKKEWVLTQDAFDGLLAWLDPDREIAGRKYETIRIRLIKLFICRGCAEAEELADETINRVLAKVNQIKNEYVGEPILYFYGTGRNVYREYQRKCVARQADVPIESACDHSALLAITGDVEPEYQCLERCLDRLPSTSRKLVLEYYQQEKQAKIDYRKRLADEMGIAVNALRIRAYRIRRALEECVHACLEQKPAH
jgi:DNA-directed RNA polymerase specialized sigma24 family protein